MLTALEQATVVPTETLDAFARRLLRVQLHGLGLYRREDLARLTAQHDRPVPDYFHRWLAESLRYIDGVEVEETDALWRQWQAHLARLGRDVDWVAKAQLLDVCLKHLPLLLTGECSATSVLFPGGSMALVEGVYKHNRLADYFNQVLIASALAYIESRPSDAEPLRILEIGAGTGGMTSGLLTALAPYTRQIDEYCYTDVSHAFLQHGAEAFGWAYPYLHTQLFDVSRPCAEQGMALDRYHLVVANNVLHATPNIRQSLRHAKATLRKGGALMINEISQASLFTHLSFGLLEAWWRYEDEALRLPACPGLSPAAWQAVLEQEGLISVRHPAKPAHGLGQQVILAQSDGMVRERVGGARFATKRSAVAEHTPTSPVPAMPAADWPQRVAAYLKALVATTLKIPEDKLHLSRPLEDYGLDSILVVRLVSAFNEHFREVDSALFFEMPTLAALTDYFIQHREAELKVLLGQTEPTHHPDSQIQGVPQLDASPLQQRDGIAIIGLAGRYPGAASMAAFWRLLADGHGAIDDIPAERWDWRGYFDPEKGKAGCHYTRWGGFLSDIDQFDAAFFRISRREAEQMDPQERLFLQVAYHSLEDAGFDPTGLHRYGEVGVFVGVMNGGYHPMPHHWSIANRVSYQLNLQGPSLAVDSACSSSLTAIHLAVESLVSGGCDIAIAGGVNLIVNPHHTLNLCERMMLSEGARCSAFGADADGFVDGEGVGAVVLKPLQQAQADGDRIYAVICGSAINAGGKTNGYTVPSASAQQRVLEKALSQAQMSAERISYVEAHGTGTLLGDPIEISGLSRVFGDRAPDHYCAIGSVKSNIGHSESAAGIAGLSKVLLQLKHGQLVPSLHAQTLNPKIAFERTPFRLQQQCAPWPASTMPRVAVISSFGAGGANASLIVEESMALADSRPAVPGPWLIPLSARDDVRLSELARQLQLFLDSDEGERIEIMDLAFTLQTGREAMAARLVLLVDSVSELAACLRQWQAGEPVDGLWRGLIRPYDRDAGAPAPANSPCLLDDLTEVATMWVEGGDIDWRRFYRDPACRRPKRVSLPGYPFARNRYWLPGLAHPPETGETKPALPLVECEVSELCYLPSWQPKLATVPPLAMGPGVVVLFALTSNGATTKGLLDAFDDYYRPVRQVVRIICHQGETIEWAAGHWRCAGDSPDFERIFAVIGPIAQIVVLGPEAHGVTSSTSVADSLARHEWPLLRLFKALTQHLSTDAVDVILLSQRRYVWPGEPVSGNPLGAGMTGLGYALAQSDHRVRLRHLDIDPVEWAEPDHRLPLLAHILAEPASERGEPVLLRHGERFVQQLIPLMLPLRDNSPSALKPQGVYLILGGSGVIGQVISRQLIAHYQARVVWLGRKSADSAEIRQCLATAPFCQRVDYLQADALDLPQLQRAVAQVKQRYGRIHGAVFSAMVIDFDNGIQQASEAQFREIVDIKSRGSVHFYQVLATESLDFLCYFSSGQRFAFSGAAKLAAYACGITFADAFVESVRPMAAFPVGVIHWGFWRASLQQQVISQHLDALEDEEGFACFARFVAHLADGSLPQLLCIKASEAVRQLMAVPEAQQYRLDSPLVPAKEQDRFVLEPAKLARLQACFDSTALDQSIAVLLHLQLQTLGIFTAPGWQDEEALRRQAGIIDRHQRGWRECLSILVAHGLLTQQGVSFHLAVPIARENHAAIWAAWTKQCEHERQDPDRRAQLALLDDCLRALPEILTGRRQATDVLFPAGSMAKVEGIYQQNTLSDFFNNKLASLVYEQLRHRVDRDPLRPVRILEVGAGTGGTTQAVLAAIAPLAERIGEYAYTDLSSAFLQHGMRHFAAGRPYFTTRILDISQPVQGFPEVDETYDIVIATNVLHATAQLCRTLAHVKTLLRGGGLLVLNELTCKTTAATVTFGLLDGWWLYEDSAMRIPGSPLLTEDSWCSLLWRQGFKQVVLHIDQGATLGQQIITAGSDGLRLQSLQQAAPRVSVSAPAPVAVDANNVTQTADALQQCMVALLAQVLKADVDSIAARVPFSDYGVDSILGVRFIKQLSARLGLSLHSALLFEHATVAKLCDYLLNTAECQIQQAFAEGGAVRDVMATNPPPVTATASPVMMAALAQVPTPSTPGRIAVIGMSGQFPEADHADQLWDRLSASCDCVTVLPPHYLDGDAYSSDKQLGKSDCNRAGILKDRDCFDPLFFQLTPHEAESMTPHQRLVMQEGWKALEDAGYNPMRLAGEPISIYIGAEPGAYHHDSFTGASEAIIASRLSYFLDLRGPAMTVNTGCSSSGVAIHLACQSLRQGESRMALAGGVYALLDQRGLISLSAIDMLSPSGRCHVFDARADGTVISEGVGIVVLKRLEDALADGDPIHGIIEASGVNQDGASNGIMAPNGEAQTQLICDTYRQFAIDPRQISYVEAHGTGTRLGDPVEANALIRAFRQFTDARGFCVLGSAKANLGHTAASAGVIGLIKILLSMRHGRLPMMPDFDTLNPLIELADSPFTINTQTIDWQPIEGRRLAALNVFGHSGTNAHLVVGDYVAEPTAAPSRAAEPVGHLFPLSAKTADSLHAYARALACWLDEHAVSSDQLPDIAYTLQTAREAMPVRASLLAADVTVLRAVLTALADGHLPAPTTDALGLLASQWVAGAQIDWASKWPARSAKRVHLPPYQFARERYWICQTPVVHPGSSPALMPTPTGLLLARPVWQEPLAGGLDAAPSRRLLLLIGFNHEQAAQLQALSTAVAGGLDCDSLTVEGAAPMAARYQALALALLQRLQALRGQVQIELWIAQSEPEHLLYAGLDGLLKTACLELPHVSARCLLMPIEGSQPLPAALLRQLTALLSETLCQGQSVLQRGTVDEGCLELQWQEMVDDVAGSAGIDGAAVRALWKDRGVYLMTGGLGGLAQIFARAIAEQCRDPVLILIGRSRLDARGEACCQALRALGARVSYHPLDLTDTEALARLMAAIRAEYGALNGVFHAAGVRRDKRLAGKSPQALVDVFAAKVIGTDQLDRACRAFYLDFFVLFSSCSAVLGSPGQADYAAANAFLDHFACWRNQRVSQGLCFGHTLSVNFPLWRDGGMQVDAETQAEIRRQTGMAPMQSVQGVRAVQWGLSMGLERLLVMEGDLSKIRAHFTGMPNGGSPMAACGAPHAVAVDESLFLATLSQLKAVFCTVTKLPPDRVECEVGFETYGIDSIMITRLNKALEQVFSPMTSLPLSERQLSKTLFFEYHSLEALAHYLVDQHARACALWCKPAEPDAPARRQAAVPAASQRVSMATPRQTAPFEPIAVIGMSGRYPQAEDLDAYWRLLKEGFDAIGEIPPQRWPLQDFYLDSAHEACQQGRSYSKWGGFLDGFADFDPLFFNISPREALNMDPQERLFLQSCWHAMEDAGITREHLAQQYQGEVGVFAGITKTGYSLYGPLYRETGHLLFPRTSFSSTANRVSYILGLHGPSEPVDTMCSSSLTALHRACESLHRGECQMAFAGGVNLYLHPSNYVELCAGQMLSKDGRCRPFGEGGNGFVPGEGVGVLLLKPLSQAVADQDNIHAVLLASAVNHGGKTHGYTVPNPKAQAEVIRQAIKRAGLTADRVSYIEAHGTGTELGDPIEISGLTQAFADDAVAPGCCALGSVKANIGHLEAAAGIAGVSKVILQFKHQQIAPSLHAAKLNPNLALDATPFRLQQTLGDWRSKTGQSRIAGVSSFGAGGANAHVLLQEQAEYRVAPDGLPAQAIVLSARDGERLHDYASALLRYVAARPQMSGSDLANLAYTLQVGREAMASRLGLAVHSPAELSAKLHAFIKRDGPLVEGVYFGEAKRHSAARALSQCDHDDLDALLQAWVSGEVVDWRAVCPADSPPPYRVSLPVYPFARDTYWLPDRIEIPAKETQPVTPPQTAVDCDALCYVARWQREAPDNETLIETHRCVLIVAPAHASAAAEALAQQYRADAGFTLDGGRVIRLQPGAPDPGLASDCHAWDIDDPQALEHCLSHYPAIDCCYFIGEAGDALDWPTLWASPRSNEIVLLKLVKWLKQHGHHQAIDFYLISQNNFAIAEESVSACGGGLTGMAYAIAQGEHRFRVRHIDVDHRELQDPARLAAWARQLRRERGLARGDVVCLRGGERYHQALFRLAWPASMGPALRHGGVYVILGGGGTVGGIISRYLLTDYQARVIWLGRRAKDDAQVQQRLAACQPPPACGALDYWQANAHDLASLQCAITAVKQRYGVINGAIFSAVVFGEEAPISRMEESPFHEILAVKSHGSMAFYRALADEPLDFLCYFSSAQSFAFSGAARLPAYAAGITFSDALVRSLRRHAAFPVGTIHWGFWLSSLKDVPADDLSAQSMSRHAGALEDHQGVACFTRFVAALRAGTCHQVIAMVASKPVLPLMALQAQTLTLEDGADVAHGVEARFRLAVAPLLAAHDPALFDEAMAGMLLVQLREMGLFCLPGHFDDEEALRDKAGIADHYDRWWTTCIMLLEQHGWVVRQGTHIGATGKATSTDLAERWQDLCAQWAADPQRQAQIALVDTCLRQLPAILTGSVSATEVIFPQSSMEKVEGVYRHNALSDAFNQGVADEVLQGIETLLAKDPQRRIRILEIGAGTGGTTSRVLPALQRYGERIAQYVYTDVSKAFLIYARKTYGPDYPFLDYQLWDVEVPPERQQVALAAYDIVIAANVLHATANIRRTLQHVQAVLRPDGRLVMNEISDLSLFSHLTFGLLKGWWRYEDPVLRLPGTPALSSDSWAQVLAETGFHHIVFPAACAHCLGQQIIVAENGLVPGTRVDDRLPLAATVRASLADTLALAPEAIAADQPLADYGLDSILGVRFVAHLSALVGAELNTALLFDYPTLDSLLDYLLAQYPTALRRQAHTAGERSERLAQQDVAALQSLFLSGELSVDALLNQVSQHHE